MRYDKLFRQFSQTVSPIDVLSLIATLFTQLTFGDISTPSTNIEDFPERGHPLVVTSSTLAEQRRMFIPTRRSNGITR